MTISGIEMILISFYRVAGEGNITEAFGGAYLVVRKSLGACIKGLFA